MDCIANQKLFYIKCIGIIIGTIYKLLLELFLFPRFFNGIPRTNIDLFTWWGILKVCPNKT
jgi:hypothetical protein